MTGIAAYKEMSVTTQNKGRLVVLLYDGAVKNLKLAVEAVNRGDTAEKNLRIGKAMDIIQELDCCLDLDAGGEIAQNLRKLYVFMNQHLLKGSVRNNVRNFQEVIALLEDLNTAWKAITT
ncbi:MAG: flagellar export chaperone FliS [Planctomycetaceae bacterium]|nr:MAG: flagellar export chaperone FliS [Planctomycetaceae bacterium]